MIRTHSFPDNHNGRPAALDLGVRLGHAEAGSAGAEQVSIAVVFVGGSGKRVFREMLRQGEGRLPDRTFAFAIDSDPDLCGLAPERVVTLTLPEADGLVERRREWPSIDRSLPARYKAGRVDRGSMMKRLVTGGIVLPYYRRRLRDEIYQRLVAPLLDVRGHADGRPDGGRRLVAVWLVGSLGGGFGSGTKDEVPALIRDEFRRAHASIKVEVTWHVFTSNVHRNVLPMDWQRSRADANCLAALLEFEAGYHDPSRVPWAALGVQPFTAPLIDRVKVYDLANERGGLLVQVEDMYSMVATALLTESLAALSDNLDGKKANEESGLSPQENASAPYGSAVAHRLVFPAAKAVRYFVLEGERRLARAAFAGRRLQGGERDAAARERYQASGLPGVGLRLANELKLALPDLPGPARGELEALPAMVQSARKDFEQRALPRLERRAAELVEAVGAEVAGRLRSAFKEMSASPSKYAPADTDAVFDGALGMADEQLARAQAELGQIDLPALAGRFERSLALLREAAELRPWFGRLHKVRKAHREAVNDFAAYAGACHRGILLRAAVGVLGRVRPTLLRLTEQARATAEAGQAALAVLDRLAGEARDQIGLRRVFVHEIVDAAWAEAFAGQLFAGTDWGRWADEVFGKEMARLQSRADLEGFLNGACARAVEEAVRPKVAKLHVSSDELMPAAARWLRQVVERAAPQFGFHEAKCGEQCQTSFDALLAAGTKEEAARLLRDLPHRAVRVIETGDPHQIIYTAQRSLVPLHAAVNNLDALEAAYRHWVEVTATNPQAEVHSNRVYGEMDLLGLYKNGSGRDGAVQG